MCAWAFSWACACPLSLLPAHQGEGVKAATPRPAATPGPEQAWVALRLRIPDDISVSSHDGGGGGVGSGEAAHSSQAERQDRPRRTKASKGQSCAHCARV